MLISFFCHIVHSILLRTETISALATVPNLLFELGGCSLVGV